jgi:hypothetical protein
VGRRLSFCLRNRNTGRTSDGKFRFEGLLKANAMILFGKVGRIWWKLVRKLGMSSLIKVETCRQKEQGSHVIRAVFTCPARAQ